MNTIWKQLWGFMTHHGVRLDAYGSAELGFRREAALELVSMIHYLGMSILGMELWRRDDDGYWIDSLAGWYSEGLGRVEDNQDALQFLARLDLPHDDVVTIQFK